MSQIKKIIQDWAMEVIPMQVTLCKVLSIDKTNCVIDAEPINGNAQLLEVRLKAVINDDKTGLIAFPKKESLVLVGLIDNNVNQAFVIDMDEVESVKFIIGDNEAVLDKDIAKVKWKQIEFNDGNNYGLVKVAELTQKLNNIETYVKALAAQFNSHTHPVSGAATGSPVAPFTNQLQNTQQSDIENTKINH